MSIPKIIHQTFKTKTLPFITRWHIKQFRRNNPDYIYEFYDDTRIEQFLENEYPSKIIESYKKLNIGAAKADFFRYALLFKKGGVYVDIDSDINGSLNSFIKPDDCAIITREGNPELFAQWALIYSPEHPFLKRTMEMVIENIVYNKYPNDVHQMTGPTVYTKAIIDTLKINENVNYRIFGIDYNKHLKFKYKLGKFFLYKNATHWKKEQLTLPVLKNY